MDPFLPPISQGLIEPSITLFLSLYPIWLPFFTGVIFFYVWFYYVRTEFIEKQGEVLLEIKIPRDINKSPLAMEIIYTSLWQKGSASWIEAYLGGKVRSWFSFELASFEGKVHFYIWTQKKFKDLLESQLYAQYPGIEVVEAEDYAKKMHMEAGKYAMWGTYYKLGRSHVYPIKTYVDFGLDKASEKEEHKTDPMTSTLEWLGSLQAGEQAWIQIMIQAHKKLGLIDGHVKKKPDWIKECEKEIEKIRSSAVLKGDEVKFPNPTKGQNEAIAAIERSMHKFPFEVGIRGIVFVPANDPKRIGLRVPGIIGAFRQYSSNYNYYNDLKIGFFTDFDYPWEDFMRIRRTKYERMMVDAYKRRSYFQYPYKYWKQKPFILTTEELATIWHIPGQVAGTPTLDRIESRKSDAPSNLPI